VSVLYTDSGAVDHYRFQKRHPVLVLVDTSVVACAPRHLLVGGLGDALATYYEARTTFESGEKGRTFFGARPSMTALAMARLCRDTLFEYAPAALASVDAKAVTPALEKIVEANTLLSGLGFESGGICVAHSCHNGLATCPSCSRGHSHGERVAFGLHVQLALEGKMQELSEVHAFCEKVGLPLTLAELSIDGGDDDLVRQIAARTVVSGESAHNEPFVVDEVNVADAIRAADRLGTLFRERRA
jgi:glycerol dehydrogenase